MLLVFSAEFRVDSQVVDLARVARDDIVGFGLSHEYSLVVLEDSAHCYCGSASKVAELCLVLSLFWDGADIEHTRSGISISRHSSNRFLLFW